MTMIGARCLRRVAPYGRVSIRDRDQDPARQLEAMHEYLRTRGWGATECVNTARHGARIRPAVTARLGVGARWGQVRAELVAGRHSPRQAAGRLGIGTATLGQLLAADHVGEEIPGG